MDPLCDRGCPEFCVKGADVNSLASLFQIGGTEGVTALEKTTRFADAPRTAPNATIESLGREIQTAAADLVLSLAFGSGGTWWG